MLSVTKKHCTQTRASNILGIILECSVEKQNSSKMLFLFPESFFEFKNLKNLLI